MTLSPHHGQIQDYLRSLTVTPNLGLIQSEREKRLLTNGPNAMEKAKRITLLERLIQQIKNPIVLLLLATAGITAFTGKIFEPILISGIVAFMAAVGIFLEQQSDASLEKLEQLQATMTTILLDGRITQVATDSIVPGDILILAEGDRVAADARVLPQSNLTVDESTLTGESLPVHKIHTSLPADTPLAERKNMLFAGTAIVEGSGKAIVVQTGNTTELGKIAALLQKQDTRKTPLEVELARVGQLILYATVGSTSVMFLVFLSRGLALTDALLTTTSLAIAFIPEGLSAVLTVTLALAVHEMVKKQVIVKKLLAAEGLGSITHIATDKTGTVTEGHMHVVKIYLDGKIYAANDTELTKHKIYHRLIDIIRFCNNNKGPTEQALVTYLDQQGFQYELEGRRAEYQFTSSVKRMSVMYEHDQQLHIFSKGAPEILIPLCSTQGDTDTFTEKDKEKTLETAVSLASKGFRVLALADKAHTGPIQKNRDHAEQQLNFIGLVALIDPLRQTVKETVAAFHAAGIVPLMITGDHPAIAKYIAEDAGIILNAEKETVLSGTDLDRIFDAGVTEKTQAELLRARVFARVRPEHKVKIVQLYQQIGCRIAMAGDGVNDAPAIKQADVGIAMSNGMDVTRDIADVIITGNYDALIRAVSIGRTVKLRTQLYLHYLLSGNSCQVGIFFLTIAFGLPVPLSPVMLLLLNILTDALPAMAMAIEPEDPDLTKRHAKHIPKQIISPVVIRGIVTQTIISTAALYFSFVVFLPRGLIYAQTVVFTLYIFQKAMRSFTARSFTKSVFQYGFFTNKLMNIAFPLVLGVWFIAVYILPTIFSMSPLDYQTILTIIPLALLMPITEEIVKRVNAKS